MEAFNIRETLGQLLMVGFWGTDAEDPWIKVLSRYIEEGKVGGVIFYGYNIISPHQLLELTRHFKSLKSPYPLWIGIDEEGGSIQRLKAQKGFSEFWSAEKVSRTLSPESAYGYYLGLAQKISQFGFNLNFAPVLDLNPQKSPLCPVIGGLERSYGSCSQKVSAFASAFSKAHAEENVFTCFKHFPGHGRILTDTHLGFSDATETWTEEELIPFKKLLKEASFLMTAHISHKKWGSSLPVTFSKDVLTSLLRKDLGFSGVLITDDLHMGAVQEILDQEQAALKALQAGNDILMFSNNLRASQGISGFRPSPFGVEDILGGIFKGLESGLLSSGQIEEAITRNLLLKKKITHT